jgi:(p)ppGpp synthase/HD superfamily hydrolase
VKEGIDIMPEMLSKAFRIASVAHEGQIDKSNQPYILHPVRVALAVGESYELKQAAVMHDVVEDTSITLDFLRKEGFSKKVVDAVDSVTRRIYPKEGVIFDRDNPDTYTKEDYMEFIGRVSKNRFGIIIKMKDIEDNVSVYRLEQLPNDIIIRMLEKYQKAKLALWNEYCDACYKVYGKVLP